MKPRCEDEGPVKILPRSADHPHARSLLDRYFAELRQRLGEFDEARSVSASASEMAPPAGLFLVLYEDDLPVACGGLKGLDPETGEIKRMFVAPEARRRGLGRRVLEALEDQARCRGLGRLVLDTASPLAEASSLYLSAGYQRVEPYNRNVYAASWFQKEL